MKKLIIIGMLIALVSSANAAPDPHEAKAVYVFEDLFPNAALLYRQPGTDGMQIFDLNKSITVVTQYDGCTRLEIASNDVTITSNCIGNLDLESLPVRKKP